MRGGFAGRGFGFGGSMNLSGGPNLMLLRHRAPIEHVVNVAKKIDDNITSFSSACRRVLSKYIPEEELQEKCPECGGNLVREEGCVHCNTCSYSKC